jgi:cobalt/nickel transport system ATP-binding protein
LEVEGLSFGFGSRAVLRDVSFSVLESEAVGIVGANGAGKSTLLWCLLGLLHAEGCIRLFGGKPERASLARMGVVFQNPEDQLFMPALLEDLTLPLLNRGVPPPTARQRALSALAQAGLEQYASEPATHLSLGQRKRAAIALALTAAPDLLVLDEPTAELDGRSVRQLSVWLSEIPVARVIASHHLEFLREVTSRLLVLGEGCLIANGPTSSILSDKSLLCRAGLI